MHTYDPIDRFVAAAVAWPDRRALEVGSEKLTYTELDRRSDHLAAQLVEQGLSGRRVAFSARRDSSWAYTVFLGLFKAGCTAVPLLPEGPLKRWRSMLEGAEVDSILAHPSPDALEAELQQAGREFNWIRMSATKDTRPFQRKPIAPDAEAYVMFTSGSTGGPKGVAVSRGNMSAYLANFLPLLDLGPTDRCSQHFALAFDLSMHDLFVTWSVGACLCVNGNLGGLRAASWARREEVTTWFAAPSQVAVMRRSRTLAQGSLPLLRLVLFCGEALPWELVEAMHTAAPKARILNLYGPTEATIAVTAYDASLPTGRSGVVPIGKPMGENTVHILPFDGLPDGEGELLLGGPQVTGGYINSKETTQKAFVQLEEPKGTWYRTGDHVRLDDQGEIQFIGRIDHQVKVLGYRVEPGEVDEALMTQLRGGNAVTVAVTLNGVVRLVSYIDVEADTTALHEHLRRSLPPAWMPERIEQMAELPRTANGKWDRTALMKMARNETA